MKHKTDSQSRQPKNCIQCGTCCNKNAPALHIDDIPLLKKGILVKQNLFTIRAYETVFNNISEKQEALKGELIKIKSKKDMYTSQYIDQNNGHYNRTCFFYNHLKKNCNIYNDRPLECRILKCWDTSDIIKQYDKNRLKRENIIPQTSALWDIIMDHEEVCSFKIFNELLKNTLKDKSKHIKKKLSEMINYDFHIRELMEKKAKVNSLELDFLFGRPLSKLLKNKHL